MKKKFIIIFLVLGLAFSGCWSPKNILTTEHATVPVFVGNVISVGGETINISELNQSQRFVANITNDYFLVFFPGVASSSSTIRQPQSTIDAQILQVIDRASVRADDFIIVDHIRYNLAHGNWGVVINSTNSAWIYGALYRLEK